MGWLDGLLGRSERNDAAQALVAAVSRASRQGGFYGEGRAPDRLEGRLELLTLHGALALMRLSGEAERPLAQAFADALFRHIDAGLREAGVGDLSVPRRMRQIASQFYGRLGAYSGAIADKAALTEALQRNIFGGHDVAFAAALAAYAQAAHAVQAGLEPAALASDAAWPAAPQ